MPMSEMPLVERIARVLAGVSLSSNGEGSDPSAADKVDSPGRACEPGDGGAAHDARAGRSMAEAGDAEVWRKMVEAAIAERVE